MMRMLPRPGSRMSGYLPHPCAFILRRDDQRDASFVRFRLFIHQDEDTGSTGKRHDDENMFATREIEWVKLRESVRKDAIIPSMIACQCSGAEKDRLRIFFYTCNLLSVALPA